MERENFNRNFILSSLQSVGPMTISEIAMRINISRPAVYAHLEILENKGMIRRSKDIKKKGAPVTIFPVQKEIAKKNRQDVLSFLQKLSEREGIDLKEFRDFFSTNKDQGYIEAALRGYIIKKIYLTDKGKDFMKKYSDKELAKVNTREKKK